MADMWDKVAELEAKIEKLLTWWDVSQAIRPTTPVLSWPWVCETDLRMKRLFDHHDPAAGVHDDQLKKWVLRISIMLGITDPGEQPTLPEMAEWVRKVAEKIAIEEVRR
jgi:hypothetical protein